MTNVSVSKYKFICRLCMSTLENEAAHQIFPDNTDSRKSILKKIAFCLRMKVNERDNLPKSICGGCAVKLDEFYRYRESCLQSELSLLKYFDNSPLSESVDHKANDFCVDKPLKEIGKPKCNENKLIGGKESPLDEAELTILKGKSIDQLPKLLKPKKESNENNLSDVDMSSPCENVAMSEDEEDEDIEEEKDTVLSTVAANKSISARITLPELAEPSPEDYVLMKEETFNLDPVKELNGATSSILADYLIEFSNPKSGELEIKDKDIMESQKLRREILPPMWDVYEKSITEKENVTSDGNIAEKERQVTVTHRRYIINKGAFPCSLCGECFEFDQGKRRDDFNEEKSKLYDCLTCGKVFPRRSSWKRHQSTHEDIKPFVCRLCNKGFNRKEHLSRHLLSHGSVKPFSCNVCGKQFVRKEHLTRHQLCNPSCTVPMDNVLRPFGCDVCSQGFVRKEHLLRHRKRAHDLDPPEGETEPKPFTCTVCTKTFTRREHLKRHQLIHQRDFTASTLGNIAVAAGARLFGTNSNSKDELFSSEVSVFSTAPLLPEITLSEIPGNSTDIDNDSRDDENLIPQCSGTNDEEVDMDDDSEEPLPPIPVLEMNANVVNVTPSAVDISKSNTFCNVCFKNFSRRSHLLRHMKRIHSMQLPPSSRRRSHQPQLPNKSGDENGNSLTDSTSVNTSLAFFEQIYKCQLCGKVFSRKSHLERHEKNIHQLDKEAKQPYECVTCGETFIQSKLLDKHMQVHGNMVPENYVWM